MKKKKIESSVSSIVSFVYIFGKMSREVGLLGYFGFLNNNNNKKTLRF